MQRREIEVKVRLKGAEETTEARRHLEQQGYVRRYTRRELDFVPDVAGFLCRANGLIVRFRRVQSEDGGRILLTFKQKNRSSQFVDAYETEMYLDEPDRVAWKHINETLAGVVGHLLPDEVLGQRDFLTVVNGAWRAGFDQFRMMIEKDRTVYGRDAVVATIDVLPGGMGTFLELEAHTEVELAEEITALGLADRVEKLDYGDIVMTYNGSEDQAGRTAVFDEDMKTAIYALARERG